MKRPIAWHEECLSNALQYEKQLRDELARLQERVDRLSRNNQETAEQILKARALGLTEFDGERFGKKRNKA